MKCYPVCPLKDLNAQHPKKFTVDDTEVLLVLGEDGEVFAFAATCTHADKPLEKGPWNASVGQITCPYHKAVFDIKGGGAVLKAPACVPLDVYPTTVQNGIVHITI